ncbi:SRPBCC domain-containing protein [Umezawaea sp. NPDC059074]|uniref:SRPBCC domain-containing protein n=1 Tax=Umezawaea sp. NPDC059074 TaxID=3346716 RepID=UPI0036AFF968
MLRLERRLSHSPERVWSAITKVSEFPAWFPGVVNQDLTEGAKLRFDMTSDQREHMGIPDDEDMSSEGEVVVHDAPRVLEYTWGDEILRWELTADGDDTALVYTDVFDDRELAAQTGSSWHAVLDLLEAHLDGRDVGTVWELEAAVHDEYERTVKVS